MADKITRIQELTSTLSNASKAYYVDNKPTMTDKDFDHSFDELLALEKETGFSLSSSPTKRVGFPVISKFQKVEHPIPLKSLDKTKLIDDLMKWIKKREICIMLKADGLTVELLYENGILVQASTRGDSIWGEDITQNAKVFNNVPLSIPFKGTLRIAGEAVIHKDNFDAINAKLFDEDKYATPRNLCSGSCRQLDSKITSERNIRFYVFNILECDTKLSDSKYDNFDWLGKQGFCTILNAKITSLNDGELDKIINSLKNYAEQMSLPIDGVVLSYDSISYSNSLGETSHHPLHSYAFKFSDETEETTLRSVEWNVTRTGQVNPVAIFDTVILDNTEVNRASLFNLTFIEELQLNIGSKINVSKRNQIIPYIEENLSRDLGMLEYPDVCPTCGAETEIRNTGTADFLYCTNDNCGAKLVDNLVHFVNRKGLNIEGLSTSTIEKFVEKGFINDFVDIYHIDKYKKEIVNMDGFGIRSYNNLIESLEKSKNTELHKFIYALGIDQVGEGGAKQLCKHFNNNFLSISYASYDDLMEVKDFGDITALSVYNYFRENVGNEKLWELVNLLSFEKPKTAEVNVSGGVFAGKKLYATGSFANYKKDDIKAVIESHGGEFSAGYAKSLDFLVVGSLKSSSKEGKAIADGVPILTEDEFIKLIS